MTLDEAIEQLMKAGLVPMTKRKTMYLAIKAAYPNGR